MDHKVFRDFEAALKLANDKGDIVGAMAIAGDMRKAMESAGVVAAPRFRIPTVNESITDEMKSRHPAEQAFLGAFTAPILAVEGIRGMFGSGNQTNVDEQRAIQRSTPYAFTGNVLGNGGMSLAFPARAGATAATAIGGREAAAGMMASRPAQVLDATGTAAGMNAAMTPGSPTERMEAALYGAIPVAGATTAMAAGQGARRMLTPAGRQIEVGENLMREVGQDKAKLLAKALRKPSADSELLGVTPSSSMVTGHPTLQVMESGSRANNSSLWQRFDATNADARWNTLRERAGTPDDLARLRGARDEVTAPMRENALASASFEARQRAGDTTPVTAPLLDKLETLRTGTARPNDNVQKMVKFVDKELEQGVTPAQLYTVRKMLTDGIANAPTSELSQAARAARPERMQIIGHIDDILNEMSRGQWSKYMNEYKGMSPPISSKAALQKIVDDIERGIPVGQTPPSMGESAAWKSVGNLRDRYGEKQFGSKTIDQLEPKDRQMVEALVTNLKSQADGMRAKGIIGSQTAGLLANRSRAEMAAQTAVAGAANHAVPIVGPAVARATFDWLAKKGEEELARLLQTPGALADALLRAAKSDRMVRGTQQGSRAAGMAGKEARE